MNMRNLYKKPHTYFVLLLFLAVVLFIGREFYLDGGKLEIINKDRPVRIGYFHGGRVNMMYRALIYDYFDEGGISVELYTRFLKEEELFKIPQTHEETNKMWKDDIKFGNPFGKMRGTEIVDLIVEGELDGGTIGESSFIASIHEGLPIVVVAMLGYDAVPGKAIIMRRDVEINSPDDLRGTTLISRRAGPGDAIFLREFLEEVNLVPGEDLTVIDQVDEDDTEKWLKEKTIDGGLYHLTTVRHLVLDGTAYVYQPMSWMDPALSHALLVFHKDYIQNHREEVKRVVDAYVKRIAYEKGLPEEQKDRSWDKGLMMEGEFQGMEIPSYDLPPRIRVDLLEEMQGLLYKYGEIDKTVDIRDFIDESFVE